MDAVSEFLEVKGSDFGNKLRPLNSVRNLQRKLNRQFRAWKADREEK